MQLDEQAEVRERSQPCPHNRPGPCPSPDNTVPSHVPARSMYVYIGSRPFTSRHDREQAHPRQLAAVPFAAYEEIACLEYTQNTISDVFCTWIPFFVCVRGIYIWQNPSSISAIPITLLVRLPAKAQLQQEILHSKTGTRCEHFAIS
jgi:hypothetical protein